MKIHHLCAIILVLITAPVLRAADLYSLYPTASHGVSLSLNGSEALVLARLSGNNGGAALFSFTAGSSPKSLSTFNYGQRNDRMISDGDTPVKIIGTADRGYALLVELKSYGSAGAGINREAGIWLIKLSPGGKREWAQVYGEKGLGYKPFDLIQTSDGGFLITGATMERTVVWKTLMIKTDARGAVTWKKSIPSSSYAAFAKAVQLASGGYFLYGYDRVQDRTNYWLVGAGAQGERVWQKTWPGMGDMLRVPVLYGTGGSFFGLVKSEKAVPRLLSFSGAGTLAKDSPIAGMKPSDIVNDYLSLPDGSFVFCGSTDNSTTDILLTKIGPGNRLLWRRTFHVDGDDIGLRVVKTKDHGYLVIATTGYSYNYSTTTYSYRQTIIKTDESGSRLWSESFSIGKSDYIADAAVMADNRCLILMSTIRNAKQEALLLVTEPGGRIGTIRER